MTRRRNFDARRIALAYATVAALTAYALLTGSAASATETATISAHFAPERLGAPTTVSFGFEIKALGGGGFHFKATFSFLDGTKTQASTIVKCPLRR